MSRPIFETPAMVSNQERLEIAMAMGSSMDVSDRSETTGSNKRVAFTLIYFGHFYGGDVARDTARVSHYT